ncbi:MAG: folate-binding protein [Aestuariivita sp.]|nr:folate-binding protein [Aestuariivita sp.]
MTAVRRILSLTGSNVEDYLQMIITNDIKRVDKGLLYAALLTPQGKYIADFFLLRRGEEILLDVSESVADNLIKTLNMYKLRSDVSITHSTLNMQRGTGAAPTDAFQDPRHPALGWRTYSPDPHNDDNSDWDAIRVAHLIPEANIELTSETYILEAGFEKLSGVDFEKGCYVGQEVTARMKHKTELRKGLERVAIDAHIPIGTEIFTNDRSVGTIYTQSNGRAIAFLRFDRARGHMTAGAATIRRLNETPDPIPLP